MKVLWKLLIAFLVVALIAFTAVFLINAYNKGSIGNKAEKVAEDFETELNGTWEGEHSISQIEFKDEGNVTLTMLGINLNGTYTDNYNLETEIHTLTVNYSSSLGISVTRKFAAKIDEQTLTLTDVETPTLKFTYSKVDPNVANNTTKGSSTTGSGTDTKQTTTKSSSEATTVYNPGIDVFKANLLGKWSSTTTSTSGYNFVDSSKVTLTLLGISYDGTYSVSVDTTTNEYIVKINYANFAGIDISNSYKATIDDNNLNLAQIGAETIIMSYTKAAA